MLEPGLCCKRGPQRRRDHQVVQRGEAPRVAQLRARGDACACGREEAESQGEDCLSEKTKGADNMTPFASRKPITGLHRKDGDSTGKIGTVQSHLCRYFLMSPWDDMCFMTSMNGSATSQAAKPLNARAKMTDILKASAAPSAEPTRDSLEVSAQIIKKLSQQMYRSPANAIKELVSNAFDADATQVRIETDVMLDKITVIDDGNSISQSEFIDRMHKIAAETKRKKEGETTPTGRPVIGKLGVGLLAVGQICNKISVIAKQKDTREGFLAKINLSEFFKEEAAYKGLYELPNALRLWTMAGIGPSSDSFTAIVLEDMRQTFRQEFMFNRPSFKNGFNFDPTDEKSFDKFVNFYLEGGLRGERPTAFDEMIWELGLITPVQYLEDGPVPGPLNSYPILKGIKERLKGYNFRVFVNDVEIRKPIRFPNEPGISNEGTDWKIYEINIDTSANGRRIKARGYFYHQAIRIIPPELRGILPRVKGVGIGSYDRTLFQIPAVLGPVIMAQTSGEVYTDEGLESALNIDRNSFDLIDPGYQKLREVVLNQLNKADPGRVSVMQDIRKRLEARRSVKKTVRAASFNASVADVLNDSGYPGWSVRRFKSKRVPPVVVDVQQRIVGVYDSDLYPRKVEQMSEHWKTIVLILILRELAGSLAQAGSKRAEDQLFYSFLSRVF